MVETQRWYKLGDISMSECSREILILRPCPCLPTPASGPEVMDKIFGTFWNINQQIL